ncbi:MAG: serine hydrolase [Acidobacteriaceae bacterium]|nr:serine hydrolase [Acidobacteriaceae bacterium]
MVLRLLALLLLLVTPLVPAQERGSSAPAPASNDLPTATPESQGYSSTRLEVLRAWLHTGPTTAMMVLANGKVIFSYGDVTHVSKIASVRKSILSILMGKYVIAGKIDPSKTVKQLGLDDQIPFTPLEERATLEQLMAARSGIYRDPPEDDLTRQVPMRGSAYPGTVFAYNNWEFDAAGTAFEKLTGLNIYDALQNDLALPLGMQDFHRERQHKIPSPGSVHPEYAMFLSTRDLARLGLLMSQMGVWNGKRIVDASWIRYTTDVLTPWEEMEPAVIRQKGDPSRWGFGSGWWVWDAKVYPGNVQASPFQGAYEARGTGGQYITVLPARGLVLVHKTDIDANPAANREDWPTITSMVLAALCPQGQCTAEPKKSK